MTSLKMDNTKVLKAIRGKSLKGKVKVTANVVYTAPYAMYVHENLEIDHPIHADHNCRGQAKYLEQPARKYAKDMAAMIAKMIKNKRSVREAVVKAATILLKLSQKLVPVDTGRLKRSGRVEVTE